MGMCSQNCSCFVYWVSVVHLCFPTCSSRNTVETNTNKSMIVRIMCCSLGDGSLPENLKEVKISNVNRAVSDCCVHIKTVIAEAFAETVLFKKPT